jgi:hypothetical protein
MFLLYLDRYSFAVLVLSGAIAGLEDNTEGGKTFPASFGCTVITSGSYECVSILALSPYEFAILSSHSSPVSAFQTSIVHNGFNMCSHLCVGVNLLLSGGEQSNTFLSRSFLFYSFNMVMQFERTIFKVSYP